MSGPTDKVLNALPGTLAEVSERTGYPYATVLGLIERLRGDGEVIMAQREPSIAGVPARAKPESDALTTVYTRVPERPSADG